MSFYEVAREIFGNERPAAEGGDTAPRVETPAQLRVCTGRDCRARWDSASLVDDLRRAVAADGSAITVTTSGCLKLCEDGPVVLAAPARGFAASTGAPAERLFVNVRKEDMGDIIDAVGDRRP